MRKNKYNLLDSETALKEADTFLMEGDEPRFNLIAVDTETNGLKHWSDVVIGISFSTDSKSGYYIPMLTWEGTGFRDIWTNKTYSEFVTQKEYRVPEIVKYYVKRWLANPKIDLIMHNATFDVLMIEANFGLDLTDQLFCDTVLLKHVVDETTSMALKETAIQWQSELGIDMQEQANQEQLDLGKSIIKNGGRFSKSKKGAKDIWRADLDVMYKYAIADTFLTFGIFEVGINKMQTDYSQKHLDWFFEDEVMPLCKEVLIPMKKRGVKIDVEHFKKLQEETAAKLLEIEDRIINYLNKNKLLDGFAIGKSFDQVVSKKKLVETIMDLEGLTYPTKKGKDGELVESLAKSAIEAANNKEPHWLWGYLLGWDELKYTKDELLEIKTAIYEQTTGKRHTFNIKSGLHLTWLFCDKLKFDRTKLPQTKASTPEKPTPSLKAEVLEEFFLGKYEFVKDLLVYKKLQKLISSYIKPALVLNVNSILYMELLQTGTTSGRFACAGGLNLQTLPKIEELDKCSKCGSKNINIIKTIELLANVKCNECSHENNDIICPSAIKRGFISAKNEVIVNADYSSLEPRCFAFMSSESKLKEIYAKDQDMYSKVYCDMMNQDYRDLKKSGENSIRSAFKAVPLGIVYGARGPQVANLMDLKTKREFYGEMKEVLDVEKGTYYMNLFLQTYPNLTQYMKDRELEANTKGFVETLIGRRRHFVSTVPVYALLQKDGMDYEKFLDMTNKELKTTHLSDVLNRQALEKLLLSLGFKLRDDKGIPRDWKFVRTLYKNELNNAKNFPIQGLAAHIANRAMLEMTRAYKKAKIDARVFLQVHDEISSYASLEHAEKAKEITKEFMETNKFAKLVDIPMIADPKVTDNLRDAK